MRHAFIIGFALLWTVSLSGVEMRPVGAGMEITAGSLGSFTLTYPEFLDEAQRPVVKQVEVKTENGMATVRYEGGAECGVTVVGDEMNLVFNGVPSVVRSWKMTMLIDIGFAKGGTWQIAGDAGAFPEAKAAPPQIASVNGTSFD